MNDSDKIIKYGESIGVEQIDLVDWLIESHKRMRETIQTELKTWNDSLEEARQKAFNQQMDASWIRLDDLKKMSVIDFVNLLADD